MPVNRHRTQSAIRRGRRGFTLVEALVSTTIVAIAGTAVLLGVANAMQSTRDHLQKTIAQGLAEQLIDEIAGMRYEGDGLGPYQTTLGPTAYEASGRGRERFNDIDDYARYDSQPPVDSWGVPIGQEDDTGGTRNPYFLAPPGYFARWHQAVDVYYVSAVDKQTPLGPGVTSDFRAVRVRILLEGTEGTKMEIASLTRVFAYVPVP